MSVEGWIIFALFWLIFVLTPGPNAVNCITNGMTLGLSRAMIGVLAILTQATAFLLLSALGIVAIVIASPTAFVVAKLTGAAFLVWLGIRAWRRAALPAPDVAPRRGSIYVQALAIATINPKSVAGYLSAFSLFVDPGAPIWPQMWVIMPTSLAITALVYTGFTALGAGLGRVAIGAVFNIWLRRVMAVGFIIYGVLLGAASVPGRP